ncbi:MAG: insulinase family protein [Flavobacteriales bacterium]|jgi:predicted Zn-dependent peptidase|nr:insulinase family protein [Flavobacteriales bacterium]
MAIFTKRIPENHFCIVNLNNYNLKVMIKRNLLKFFVLVFLGTLLSLLHSCDKKEGFKEIESGKNPFEYKVYQLDNGLKVYLSKNEVAPRIQTYIGVKVGSKNDPNTHTGLAHYLEHLLFKGTQKLGTDQWEKERPILDKIEEKYEQYQSSSDGKKREKIYQEIDSLSYIASQYSIANEYDKIMAEMGSNGTNAYTSFDQTVYLTNIPSKSLEKWVKIEADRFQNMVIRLFHTELEAVYEEYNISCESDDDRIADLLMKKLYPQHGYGTKTTIGKPEHLKNPSIKRIKDFYNKYYIPNNMVMVLSGDLNYENTIKKIAKEFGSWNSKELIKEKQIATELKGVENIKTIGNESAKVAIGYRLPGYRADDNFVFSIIERMLFNGFGGLMDKNLIKSNRVQDAYAYLWSNEDYSTFILGGNGHDNQELVETQILLFEQIELLKLGAFPDWLPKAAYNDLKNEYLKRIDNNEHRANEMLSAGLYDYSTEDFIQRLEKYKNISKQDIVKKANDFFKNNYCTISMEQGNFKAPKIAAPKITPIKRRKNSKSDFYKEVSNLPEEVEKQEFKDIDAILKKNKKGNYFFVENKANDLFQLEFIMEKGSYDNPLLALGLEYIKQLGSAEMSQEELTNEFYKNGVNWDLKIASKTIRIQMEGLAESLPKTLSLIENLIQKPKPNSTIFKSFIASKIKQRSDLFYKQEDLLWKVFLGHIKHGKENPMMDTYSKKFLTSVNEKDLLLAVNNFFHELDYVHYFGPKPFNKVKKNLEFVAFDNQREEKNILEKNIEQKTYFMHHQMVQAEVLMVAKSGVVHENNWVDHLVYKGYFGNLAYRELRESRGLAYSTYITIREATRKNKHDYVMGYIGAQADKLPLALNGLKTLIKRSPDDVKLFEESKTSLIKQIQSQRLKDRYIFERWYVLQKKGFERDLYEKALKKLENYSFNDFVAFYENNIANLDYSTLILGDKTAIDFNMLDARVKNIEWVDKKDLLE